ncbi:zinc ABC transporter substrate-binding protein ZnuA [Aquamicrobium sp. LC103]|uniref:zinc ABC transporter substrate-binding protein ZnuA n=1 Tax=Aquamicrobium sp. LC103 TaxID=1120658 RepID=UPI00063E95D0|nr:zinc ABC transporter substrate-binding protein ZnuA [Aquamicrobium sp. LC103]TKT69136.1 zinc ABC transporter substrate-binding protein ZnuA [Aquamicrobium sp. LC103]
MTKSTRALCLASAAFLFAGPGSAHALDGVVASIKPVHSLVSAVMEGVGEPTLIVRGTGSEHVYSLRPSDAAALEQASVIFWVGHEMETFLDNPIKTLGGGAKVVALEDTRGLVKLKFREGGPFEAHDHGDGHGHDDGHDHEHDHGHHHGEHDLHFWLDPDNAKLMLDEIERTLAEADPDNAERYTANAAAYATRIDELSTEIEAELGPVKDRPVVVFHDAYQYFETKFGLNVVGSITVSPEVMPGAQRVSEIKAKIEELDAACVFAEPQFEPRLVSVVTEGTNAKTGVLDPLGADLTDGPELYLGLIRDMAGSLKDCLGNAS